MILVVDWRKDVVRVSGLTRSKPLHDLIWNGFGVDIGTVVDGFNPHWNNFLEFICFVSKMKVSDKKSVALTGRCALQTGERF